MAKIRVEQIKDLGIVTVENGVDAGALSIQIGAQNSIIPLTGVSFASGSAESGYISAAERKGNVIELTRTALPTLDIPEVDGQFVLNAVVDETNNHQINLTKGTFDVSTNADGAQTGSLIFGADNVLKVNAAWVKGELATVASTGKAEDVSIADEGEQFTAENVEDALAELAGKIAAIDPVVTTVAAGTGISVTQSATTEDENDVTYTVAADFTVDTKKYPTESTAEGYDAEKAGKTYIRIMAGTTIISETDAAAFIKDGFLQEVKLIEASEGQENVLRFTWNSDAGIQVTDIKVSDLCDVYTAKANDWIKLTGFEFSHKTQDNFTQAEGEEEPQTSFGDNVAEDAEADVTIEGAGQSAKFAIPSFVVDAAGHVTAAEDRVVKVTLPAAPNTAEKTIITYEPKKEVFTPATGTNTVSLTAEAYDYDVYLNGQLLAAGDATLGGDNKTITLTNYAEMITEGDEIIVRYFVKHEETFTVFAPATPQA